MWRTRTPLTLTVRPPFAMSELRLLTGDNLQALAQLKASGERFDLVELDGPYMAGLEDWDNLTEEQYIQHYADRLTLVRDVLQPWGVVFVFGYPEGCAEIKSWAHRSGVLYLRRWLTWYKQVTAHKGRKVENVLFFWRDTPSAAAAAAWGKFLKSERVKRGWTLRDVGDRAGRTWWHRGGNLYFENGNGGFPSLEDILTLGRIFDFKAEDWPGVFFENYEGLTEIDYFDKTYIEDTKELNDNGLRSKPVGLYVDLFRPTIPPTDTRRALVLYGGSGNAGIAAGALGYDVTICEKDEARAQAIAARFDKEVSRWRGKTSARQSSMFTATQLPLSSGV